MATSMSIENNDEDPPMKEIVASLKKLSKDVENNTNNLKIYEDKFIGLKDIAPAFKGSTGSADLDTSIEQKGQLCDYIKQFASNSSLHGLPNITTAKHVWMRLFWGLLLIGGFGLAVYQSTLIFTEYFQFPVLTQFKVQSGNAAFPQVTFCNRNGYFKSKVEQHPKLEKYTCLENRTCTLKDFHDTIAQNLTEEERKSLSFNLRDFLLAETGLRYSLFPSLRQGNCYTLKKTGLDPQGTHRYLMVYINLNADEYIDNTSGFGVEVTIRESGLYPLRMNALHGLFRPGILVEIKMSLETINLLGGRYGNCEEDVTEFVQETGLNYSQDICRHVCISDTIVSKCGCYPYNVSPYPSKWKIGKRLKNVPYCDKDLPCYLDQRPNAEKSCYCKPRCRMKKYRLSVTKHELRNVRRYCMYWPKLCKNASNAEEMIRSNILNVVLVLDNTQHKEFTQIPGYPLSRFLSDLGGTFGLYIGASLMTLFELPQLAIVSMISLVRRRKI